MARTIARFKNPDSAWQYLLGIEDDQLMRELDRYRIDPSFISTSKSYLSAVRKGRRSLSPQKRAAARDALMSAWTTSRVIPLRDWLTRMQKKYPYLDIAHSWEMLHEHAKMEYVIPDRRVLVFTDQPNLGKTSTRMLSYFVILYEFGGESGGPRYQWFQHVYYHLRKSDIFDPENKKDAIWEVNQIRKRMERAAREAEKNWVETYTWWNRDDVRYDRIEFIGLAIYQRGFKS